MIINYSRIPGQYMMHRSESSHNLPLVSIITALDELDKHFDLTYNSIINQTLPWFEWIVISNNAKIKIETCDSRIVMLSHPCSDKVKARQHGVGVSRSDIKLFVNAGDVVEKRWVECLYWGLELTPEADWIYSDVVTFEGSEHVYANQLNLSNLRKGTIYPDVAGIRKRSFNAIENIGDEAEMWLSLFSQGLRPAHVNAALYWKRTTNTIGKKQPRKWASNLAKTASIEVKAFELDGSTDKEFSSPQHFNFNYDNCAVNDTRTKILLLLHQVVHGGSDWFNIQLAKNINRDEYAVSVICTGFDESDEWLQELDEYCEDLYVLKEFMPLHEWPGFVHYYIKSRNVEVVWSISCYYGYYLLPWLRKEFPNLAISNYVHADAEYWRSGGYGRLSSAFRDITDLTVTTNRATLDILRNRYGFGNKPAEVSYIGTDVDYYDPSIVPRGEIRSKYKIPLDAPVVLFLCRIALEKRPFLMLHVAEKLIERLPGTHFLVVGNGNEVETSKNLAGRLGIDKNVIFCGSVDDTRYYYRDADVLLICSLKEGLAQTTFEAMAMGLPVVSSDVGGQSELVNGSTGALVTCRQAETELETLAYNPIEIDDYVDALYRFASDTAYSAQIGQANRELVLAKYSTKQAARDLERYSAFLLTDAEIKNRREMILQSVSSMPALIDETITVYGTFEKMQQDAFRIYRTIYNSIKGISNSPSSKSDKMEMIFFYFKAITGTAVGRFMWRIAERLFNLYRRIRTQKINKRV